MLNSESKTANQPQKAAIPFWTFEFCNICLVLILILAVGSISGQYLAYFKGHEGYLTDLLDMDQELSIPTIYSVILLFWIVILLAVTTILKIREKDAHIWKWGILTFGFLFMAFDEGACIHELLMRPVYRRIMYMDVPRIFYFSWVIPGIIGVIFLAIFYGKFLFDLPKHTRNAFLISGLVYVGGALGVELVGGYFASIYGMHEFGFEAIATIEETLEMLGLMFFLKAMMSYLQKYYSHLQIHFT